MKYILKIMKRKKERKKDRLMLKRKIKKKQILVYQVHWRKMRYYTSLQIALYAWTNLFSIYQNINTFYQNTGNVYNGVVLKWTEPVDAKVPKRGWRLYVFKGDEILETLYLHRQSSYLFGREERVADHVLGNYKEIVRSF
jgi:hypothetical protein